MPSQIPNCTWWYGGGVVLTKRTYVLGVVLATLVAARTRGVVRTESSTESSGRLVSWLGGFEVTDEDAGQGVSGAWMLNLPRGLLRIRRLDRAAVLRAVGEMDVECSAVIVESSFDSLLSAVRNRFRTMQLPAFALPELLVSWGGVQAGFSGFAHNPVEYAASVHRPALVIHGSQDPRVPKEQSEAVFRFSLSLSYLTSSQGGITDAGPVGSREIAFKSDGTILGSGTG